MTRFGLWPVIGRMAVAVAAALTVAVVLNVPVHVQGGKTMTTEEDFRRAFKELSNWGRWGQDDELGAANLVTPAKRKAAAALVREGVAISLAHDIFQEEVSDGRGHLQRTLAGVRPGGASDVYAFTGTYHGSIFSHMDAINCHQMLDGKGYNGRTVEDINAAGGCPRAAFSRSRTAW